MKVLLIGNGFDLENNVEIRFEEFVDWIQNKDLKSHEKYFSKEYWIEYSSTLESHPIELWSDFEGFLWYLVSKMGLNITLISKINLLFEEWFDSIHSEKVEKFSTSQLLTDIFKKNNFDVALSLNYTNTLSMYGFKKAFIDKEDNQSYNLSKLDGRFLNLHQVKTSPKYILGHDCKNSSNKSVLLTRAGFPDRFKHSIFSQIRSEKSELHIYGYSFGKSDEVINELIKKNVNSGTELYIYLFCESEVEFIKSKKKIIKQNFENEILKNIKFINTEKIRKKDVI